MAKQSGDPDSATSQWFVNLSENQENLDNQNGGFTVFGALDDAAAFVSRINELDPENGPFLLDLGAPFSELPVLSRDTPGFSDLLYFEIRVERPGGRLTVSAQGDGLRIALHEALPEESYRLESSRDLRTWEAVETVTTNASGEATFPLQTPETASRVFLARPVID